MKKSTLLISAALLLSSFLANAQVTFSTIPEATAGSSTNVTKTCNDARFNTTGAGSGILSVIGWDGANPRVFYRSTLGATGTLALPVGATDPDVAISANTTNSNPFMLLVYRLGGNFIFARYKWTGTAFSAPVTSTFTDAGSGYTPNITVDATRNGDYAFEITQSNGQITVYTGTNAALPSGPLASGVAPVLGHYTDICLNTKPGSVTTNVYLSYTDMTNSKLFTISATYAGITFGAPTLIAGPVAGTSYANPHIGSPVTNSPSCPSNDIFSVIYDEVTASYYYMHLYSQEASGTTDVRLTAGDPGFPTPAIQFSKRPALCYNEKFSWTTSPCTGALTAGWQSGASGFPSMYGEKLTSAGSIYGPVTYYDICNPSRSNCDFIAIGGKYSQDNILISFYDYSSSTIQYKFFSYAASTLRKAGTEQPAVVKNITLFPNPASTRVYVNTENIDPAAQVQVNATDITGKALLNTSNTISNMQSEINNWFTAAAPGVYFIKFTGDAGYVQTVKLVKQ
ncbi:T9SS type A sorting domain-containing protein [Chitinophagaceae bacterium MMS25-I14]